MQLPRNIINAVLFNLSWFAIVLTQSPFIAPVIVAVHLLLHMSIMGKGKGELLLIGAVTLGGAVVDQLLFGAGVFNVAGKPALAPLWLACLWPVFATTLMHSFAGLQQRVSLAAVLGALGGALSYSAGVRLSAVEFGSPRWGPVLLAALWALAFPLLLQLSARFSRQRGVLHTWDPPVRRALD